jgi:NAD(P)-dependent dehydrogenase (short-subunit alcohol dehydrogenase family)
VAPNPALGAALVTGAALRIGRAVALDLADAGYAVAIHYRNSAAEAEANVRAIAAKGGRAVALRAELAEHGEVESLVPRAIEALGPLRVLVNNASIFEFETADTATRESWDRHMAINLRAPFFLAQAFAKSLDAGATGAVINMLDERVWHLTPYYSSYTLTKAGLWTLTKTLAQALAPRIRVNAVGPGPTLRNSFQSEAEFAEQCASMPLGRGTTPAEICAAIRFVLTAPAMTGQMIALDGGQHLEWRTVDKKRITD